jgi:hypothetical protein
MKRIIFALAVLLNTVVLNAQTTVGNVGTQTTVQGKDTKITSIYTTTVSSGVGGVVIGGSGQNTSINGAATAINTSNTNISSAGGVNINTSTLKLTGSQTVTGNLTVNQTISSSQAIQTTGTGSISSAYSLSAAGNKFNVSGDAGNVRTNGTFSAASGSFEVNSSGKTLANQGLSVNGAAGFTVGSEFKVAPTGFVTSNGINNSNQKISNIAKGTDGTDAVNVDQLNFLERNLKLDIKEVQNNLDLTNTKLNKVEVDITNLQNTKADKTEVTALDRKLTTEVSRLDKRIDATDTKVSDLNKVIETNKAEAKAYTDVETLRAKNAENALGKRIDDEANRAKDAEAKLNNDIIKVRDNLVNETNRAMRAEAQITNEMMGIAAMSAAMSAANGSQIYNSEKRGNLSFGTGFYGNAKAFAAGFSYFVSPNAKISANVASGSNTRAAAAGIGFSIGF